MFSSVFALETLIKSTVLLAVANILVYALRNQSARPRVLLWRSVAAALLLLPVLSWIAGRGAALKLAILPVFSTTVDSSTAPGLAFQLTTAHIIWLVWAAVAGALVMRILIAHYLIWRSVRKDLPRDGSTVVRSASVAGPVAWGILRPRVLLPASSLLWSSERLDIVLAHETTHVDGRDCLWQFLAQCVAALYWFHPLAWKLFANLREDTEFYCDEVLLALGYRPSAYAETLLAFANAPSHFDRLCPVTVAVARRTTIGRRIQRILSMDSRHRFSRLGAVAAILAFALVFPLAAMQSGKSEKVYKVGDGVSPPVPVYKVNPRYTPEAKEAKIQGTVRLEVVIDSEGRVTDISLLQGIDAGLDQNAIDAVKTWTFEPARKDGKPVSVRAKIDINFTLA
jgi:TonB family protein